MTEFDETYYGFESSGRTFLSDDPKTTGTGVVYGNGNNEKGRRKGFNKNVLVLTSTGLSSLVMPI